MTFACVLFLFAACHETEEKRISPLGIEDGETTETAYDLDKIQETGELIAVTLSGPDTYYEYRGKASAYSMNWLNALPSPSEQD